MGLRVARVRAGPAAKRPVGQLGLAAAGVVLDLALKRAAENLARRERAAVAGGAAREKVEEVTQAAEIGVRAGQEAPADKVAPADLAAVRAAVQAAVRVADNVAALALVATVAKAAVRPKSPMKYEGEG